MVKYTLEMGKDFAVISPELKDKFPKLIDTDAKGQPLKKVAKQKAVYVYVNADGKESEATGKGILKDGEVVSLNKVENLKGFQLKKVPREQMFDYSIQGTYKVLKTSLSLKDGEAMTFLFAVSKGYMNTVRGFVFRRGEDYFLVKTTVNTIVKLTESFVVEKEEVTEQKQTISPTEMLSLVGVEA